jgi:hypothetical protein
VKLQAGSVLEVMSGMSKNNNVNPSQYTSAGRERQGEDVNTEREKMKASQLEHEVRQQAKETRPTEDKPTE